MKKNTLLLVLLISTCIQAQTTFDWESNTSISTDLLQVTQTKDGITVTATMPRLFLELNASVISGYYDGAYPGTGWEAMQGTVFYTKNGIGLFDGTSDDLTFTFSEPVTLNKFFAGNVLESPVALHRVTFSTTDGVGNNDVVLDYDNVTMHEVVLNWTDVTSFTVSNEKISGAGLRVNLAFDGMLVNKAPLSIEEQEESAFILYPNPVEDLLHVKTNTKINGIKVFNSLGKMLLETTNKTIDFNNFSEGIYFVQINSDLGSETKRVVKY